MAFDFNRYQLLLAQKRDDQVHTGVMVALYPSPLVANQLALKGAKAEPVDELHLTLAFLGKTDDHQDGSGIGLAVDEWAAQTAPIAGEISGVGVFTANKAEGPVTYASVDLPSLPEARAKLVGFLDQLGIPPSRQHGYTPHITLAYDDQRSADVPNLTIVFDKVTVCFGEERTDYPLQVDGLQRR